LHVLVLSVLHVPLTQVTAAVCVSRRGRSE
jgi:hypothetical protein